MNDIYAVGNVRDQITATLNSLMEGLRLVNTLFGGMDRLVDHIFVVATLFTKLKIGAVGYIKEKNVLIYKDITVYKFRLRPMTHSFMILLHHGDTSTPNFVINECIVLKNNMSFTPVFNSWS